MEIWIDVANTAEARRVYTPTRRIVFTCGCFDLLHPGHIAFLRRARMLGDRLCVGVHVCLDKRPIFSVLERRMMLEALSDVDFTVVHNHKDDEDVVSGLGITHWAISPEWDEVHHRCAGVEYVIIPRHFDISTSEIKKRCYERSRLNSSNSGDI